MERNKSMPRVPIQFTLNVLWEVICRSTPVPYWIVYGMRARGSRTTRLVGWAVSKLGSTGNAGFSRSPRKHKTRRKIVGVVVKVVLEVVAEANGELKRRTYPNIVFNESGNVFFEKYEVSLATLHKIIGGT